MSIIRTIHNRENPYTLLNRQPLFDPNLSLKAKGLWAQCMSRPGDWDFYVSEIIKNSSDRKGSTYSAISELIKCGYAIRTNVSEQKSAGKFSNRKVIYTFFEFKITKTEMEKFIEEFKGDPDSEISFVEHEHFLNPKSKKRKVRKTENKANSNNVHLEPDFRNQVNVNQGNQPLLSTEGTHTEDTHTYLKVCLDPTLHLKTSSSSNSARITRVCEEPIKKLKETLSPPSTWEEEEGASSKLEKRKNQKWLQEVVDERAWKNADIKKTRLETEQEALRQKEREDSMVKTKPVMLKDTEEFKRLKAEEDLKYERIGNENERINRELSAAVAGVEIPYIINTEQVGTLFVTVNQDSATFSTKVWGGGGCSSAVNFREWWGDRKNYIFLSMKSYANRAILT